MENDRNSSLGRTLFETMAMFGVAALSLVLLIYVAFGEAKRNYERFQIEKLVAQGQVVQNVLEAFVRPGLPAQQFVGFNQIAEPMVKADPLIDAIGFRARSGDTVFQAGTLSDQSKAKPQISYQVRDGIAEVQHFADRIEVALPVRNRFEEVGNVILTVPKDKIVERVEEAFKPLVYLSVCASLLFAVFVMAFPQDGTNRIRNRWIAGAFVAMFVSVSIVVISTLVSVYSQGAQARAKSLADSLGQRLDDLVTYNINLEDVTGIIALFGDYKRLNPDIRAAALMVDGKVRAHVDPTRRNVPWDTQTNDYEYTISLSQPNNPREVEIKVALPRDVVTNQVLRSVKNFAALFIASAFFAALFMGLARSLKLVAASRDEGSWSALEETATINLVKPVFFLAVFVEHLSYAFLPTLMRSAAEAASLPASYATIPFAVYYLMFAFALIPAGRLERRFGAKTLILLGLTLASGGLGMLSVSTEFWFSVLSRALAGVGQGTLFIGVQAYILANSSPGRRTRAGGAIVFGFQAGMIAGMAIGSLLVSSIDAVGVFTLGAAIGILTLVYGLTALPSRLTASESTASMHSAWGEFLKMLSTGSFFRAVFLVGIPAKAILTGVVLFGLPILLSQAGYPKEDVGQITMVYAGAVILSSHFASSWADTKSGTESILFTGVLMTCGGLASMAAVGMIDMAANPLMTTFLIVAGVILVGAAHGYINAPIVTHITNSEAADEFGVTNTAAAYRLMERIGHVLGPVAMGQLFLHFGVSWSILGGIAVAIFVLGAIFLSHNNHVEQPAPAGRH